jgi:GNAT superfamily N-acetyltransferase
VTGPTSDGRIVVAHTDELGPARFAALDALCTAAFEIPFAPVWERVGPGIHVIAEVGGRPVAHAMVVDRRLFIGPDGGGSLDAGYVENVATDPGARGHGHASLVMREIGRLVRDEYVLGALATTRHGFYRRLGWESRGGPTWVVMPDGERVRSPEADPEIMVLRTPRTPATLELDGPIGVDWRPGRSW